MDLIVRLLIRLGLIDGKTFDKAVNKLASVDAYIEKLEAQEKAKEVAAQKVADRALLTASTAAEKAKDASALRATLPKINA
ncbi:hypothetical protein KEU06_08795 [Pseudaminobacter sp. 19-2017]|uniref:Uncharacterized protein n=1 Tax=Pseudaminobacter soli (ex Zhang et al. 2022) TaxID=2831468 RepID=A0A942I7U2_9HYPH|nr:hypothetical protein [Pseudaminobacter soli]MBS3648725.1 hypothetical protein [Pseudaminobacter soli]